MHSTDLGLGAIAGASAVLVILGAFFNIFQSAIQIIGLGTAISLSLTAYKYVGDTSERRRMRVAEGIRRLKPEIYDPFLSWAIVARRTIENHVENEFAYGVMPPPDFSSKGDFVAVIGTTLRSAVEKVLESLSVYSSHAAQARQQYYGRVEKLVQEVHPEWKAGNCWIYFDGGREWDLRNLLYTYDFRMIKRMVESAKALQLSERRVSEGGSLALAGVSLIRALEDPSDLPEFSPLRQAKVKVLEDLSIVIEILKRVIVKGESDWNV